MAHCQPYFLTFHHDHKLKLVLDDVDKELSRIINGSPYNFSWRFASLLPAETSIAHSYVWTSPWTKLRHGIRSQRLDISPCIATTTQGVQPDDTQRAFEF